MDERITGKTKLLALIGNPVEHTISPQLHNTLSSMLGIDAIYVPIKVEREKIGDMIKGFKASSFIGFNATIPFKEDVLGYADAATDEVKLMGCANTIKIRDGCLSAYNTDADGFVRDFEEKTGVSFRGKRVAILGAGGTCRSLAIKMAYLGSAEINIVNRTIERARQISEIINTNIADICKIGKPDDIIKLQQIIDECDILINTTSVGLHPNSEASPIPDVIKLGNVKTVYDVIYNPGRTVLLKKAEAAGCKTVNGLGMLFYQGVLAYEIWMDIKIPDDILRKLYNEFSILQRKIPKYT